MRTPDRKPRILVLTSTFPRWAGDTEPRFVLDLCRHLAEYADIRVLAPHTPGAAREEVLDGIQVHRFRYFLRSLEAVAYKGGIIARIRENPWRLLQLPLFLAALWWTARRCIRSWRPDLIHAHWIIPQGLVACLAAGKETPVLCTSHGGDLHGLNSPWFRWWKVWTLRRCRAVTVVSDSMVPHVHALVPCCLVRVIPMGTDLVTRFVPPSPTETRDESHIVFVGRLVRAKGLHCLLDALARVADTRPDVRLTVAGDGPLRFELMQRADELHIAERVTFLGSVSHADLPALYQRAALSVFPFVGQEGFGLVVVEAMGCGSPVIASDVPAVRQTIERGMTGMLVPPGDADSLCEAIDSMLADPSLRTRMARAASQTVHDRFGWPVTAVKYRQLIETEILG